MPKNTDKKDTQATPTAGPAPQQSAAPTTPQPKGGKKAGAKSDKMAVGKNKDGKDSKQEKKKDDDPSIRTSLGLVEAYMKEEHKEIGSKIAGGLATGVSEAFNEAKDQVNKILRDNNNKGKGKDKDKDKDAAEPNNDKSDKEEAVADTSKDEENSPDGPAVAMSAAPDSQQAPEPVTGLDNTSPSQGTGGASPSPSLDEDEDEDEDESADVGPSGP